MQNEKCKMHRTGRTLFALFILHFAFCVSPAPAQELGLLDRDQWLNGGAVAAAFEPLLDPVWHATVQVICDGQRVALGVIVTADGWIVTKASEVQGGRSLGVVLHDGRAFRGKLAATDDANDLALLRVAADELPVMGWGDGSAELGRWVATVWPAAAEGESETPWWQEFGSELLRLSGTGNVASPAAVAEPQTQAPPKTREVGVGVVSASRRAVAREGGVIGVILGPGGPSYGGVVVARVEADSGAAAAGLRSGDIISHVQGQATFTAAELSAAIRSNPPGHRVAINYLRNGRSSEATVTLGRQEQVFRDYFFDPHQALSGEVSTRRDGFTAIIEHHIPLHPTHCGGPIINLDGQVIALNIARVNRSETYAIPADVVREAVQRMISQATAAHQPAAVD